MLESKSMYVQELEIRNVKAIRGTHASFSYPGTGPSVARSNVNLLLGNNGTGKTTILASIALSVLAPIIKSSGFFARHMVTFGERDGFTQASLLLHKDDYSPGGNLSHITSKKTRLDLSVRGDITELIWDEDTSSSQKALQNLYEDDNPGYFLLGYGATRRVDRSEDASSREKSRSIRYQRVAGLFEDHYALVPIKAWFPKLNKRLKRVYSTLFDDLLPDELIFNGRDGTEFLFEHHGVPMPFEALSDGYRAYVGLVSDIFYHLSKVTKSDPRKVKGTILIDEIDLHLHPRWQLEVLDRLSSNLHNLQFIVTSHSAIVAGTVPNDALLVLNRSESGKITTARPEQSIYGLSADQILVSDHFGLETTRAPGPALELREISRKAMKGHQSGDLGASIEYLKKVAASNNRPFDMQPESIEPYEITAKVRQNRGRMYNSLVRFANRMDDQSTFSRILNLIITMAILVLVGALFWFGLNDLTGLFSTP